MEIVYDTSTTTEPITIWLNRDKRFEDPHKPCGAMCGSDDKIAVLSARFAAGVSLWNSEDNTGMIDRCE